MGEKNVPDIVHALQKIKNKIELNLGTKKKQMTLHALHPLAL